MSMQALEATGGFRRWMVSLAIIAVLLVVTFLAVTAFFPGETYIARLGKAYDALWMNTTREQFTRIMQREPWLYIIPAGGIVFVSG